MFTEPQEDSTLWRYLDFSKFCSMLQRKAVYFSNPSEFSDKQEGKLINTQEIAMMRMYDAITPMFAKPYENIRQVPFPDLISKYRYIANMGVNFASKAGFENREAAKSFVINLERYLINSEEDALAELGKLEAKVARQLITDKFPQLFVKPIFIYCWHENPVESEGMWRIYGNKGLALKSTPAKLKSSLTLPETTDTHTCLSALNHVKYVDDPATIAANLITALKDTSKPLSDDPFQQHLIGGEIYKSYLLKDSAYRHENEVRFIHQEIPKGPPNLRDPQMIFKGKYITCDLPNMITEIVISPYAEGWFLDVVSGVIAREGLSLKLVPSSLNL